MTSSQAAYATTIQYDLTSDHCTGTCGPAGTLFGTITLTDIAGGVQLRVDLAAGFVFIKTGSEDVAVGFNLTNNASITEGTGALANSDWDLKSGTAGSLHLDGFGNFEYGLRCLVCGPGASSPAGSPMIFNIIGAVNVANFVELTTGGASDHPYFAVDVYSSITGKTGWVDASEPGHSVPDGGSTAMLLGSAMVGLSVLRRKFGSN